MGKIRIREKKIVPISKVVPNSWNPNEQDELTFNALVENIEEIGLAQNIKVAPISIVSQEMREQNPNAEFVIIDGEHTWRAAQIIDPDGEIEVAVLDELDVDMAKLHTVRFNVIAGRLDKDKFLALFKDVSSKHGQAATKELMKFTNEAEWKRLLGKTRSVLPPIMQAKFDEVKDELKTIDDLSLVLNTLFTRYGDTLQHSFMVFTYGGKIHHLIRMDKVLMKKMEKLEALCQEIGIDINEELAKRL